MLEILKLPASTTRLCSRMHMHVYDDLVRIASLPGSAPQLTLLLFRELVYTGLDVFLNTPSQHTDVIDESRHDTTCGTLSRLVGELCVLWLI
jgi:hypothetical protein